MAFANGIVQECKVDGLMDGCALRVYDWTRNSGSISLSSKEQERSYIRRTVLYLLENGDVREVSSWALNITLASNSYIGHQMV